MKKLFAVGIGGKVEKANIEVHDVQFVIADKIEDTFQTLRDNWYGDRLHMDEYKVVEGADGYRIELAESPQQTEQELYFVNMGGYTKEQFGELHEHALFTAKSEEETREKGNTGLLSQADTRHVDAVFRLEERMIGADGKQYYLRLVRDEKAYNFKPDWSGYQKLN